MLIAIIPTELTWETSPFPAVGDNIVHRTAAIVRGCGIPLHPGMQKVYVHLQPEEAYIVARPPQVVCAVALCRVAVGPARVDHHCVVYQNCVSTYIFDHCNGQKQKL